MSGLPPLSTIGIVGAGQLGRMTTEAAHRLGFRTLVLSDHNDAPATHVSPHVLCHGFLDEHAADAFAQRVDVVTFEFENIPAGTLARIAKAAPVLPRVEALRTTQDRELEKRFIEGCDVRVAPWVAIASDEDRRRAEAEVDFPAILKTCTLGYDGRGQRTVDAPDMLDAAWTSLGRTRCVLEKRISFSYEISAIVARSADGRTRAFPTARNEHRDHILHRSLVPSGVTPAVESEALRIAGTLADALDLVGLLTVEFFVVEERELLVNELAPRPHNSGHWTLDACATSQFEQLVRAVAGLPLASTDPLAPCEMVNLIGDEVARRDALLAEPRTSVHLYGKGEARRGRKMGHFTRLLRG